MTARQKLFAARERRVRPGLDDKVLTAWNALAISGIAHTVRTLDAPPLLGLAENALDNLYNAAWRDGRLYAKAGADAARFPGYLDDHALLLDALIDMLQCRWSERDPASSIHRSWMRGPLAQSSRSTNAGPCSFHSRLPR